VVFALEARIALVAALLVMVVLVQAAEVAAAQYLRRVHILKLRRYAQVTLWAYPAVLRWFEEDLLAVACLGRVQHA
jgi:hypothetical protein